jgi:hypothetical protein
MVGITEVNMEYAISEDQKYYKLYQDLDGHWYIMGDDKGIEELPENGVILFTIVFGGDGIVEFVARD